MIEENILNRDHRQAILWQTPGEDAVAEPAITLRTYFGELIGIRQEGAEIIVNVRSVGELTKLLRKFAAHTPKDDK